MMRAVGGREITLALKKSPANRSPPDIFSPTEYTAKTAAAHAVKAAAKMKTLFQASSRHLPVASLILCVATPWVFGLPLLASDPRVPLLSEQCNPHASRPVTHTPIRSPSLANQFDEDTPEPDRSAAASLRQTVQRHLRDGRIDAALRAAQDALDRLPDDPAVRDEFIDLHLSLARAMLAEERFDIVETAVRAIQRLEPGHPDARRWQRAIVKARRDVPAAVEEARRWIELEWFEPAFNALRQAVALRPERRDRDRDAWLAAAVGAGDDEYLTKNFHEAFYYYDAALSLYDESGRPPAPDLVSRWLQSMAHALARDVDRAEYPPDYWNMVLGRADALDAAGRETDLLRAALRGMACENLGRREDAARHYARAAGRPASGDAADLARARAEAVARVRALYDDRLPRRRGLWSRHGDGDWQTLDAAPFRIFHRNEPAARLLLRAARFHRARVARLFGRDADELAWNVPCDLYLHAGADAFAAAAGRPADVRALSVIRRRGDALEAVAIHLHQADPLLLSASLPHELAHLAVAALVGPAAADDIPPALSEGLALAVEPGCRRRQFARLFAELPRPRTLKELFAVGDLHPPQPAFYAESARLVAVLQGRGGLPRLVDLFAESSRRGVRAGDAPSTAGDTAPARSITPARLAAAFDFAGRSSLEAAYRPPAPRSAGESR